jgi:hypothetical protein
MGWGSDIDILRGPPGRLIGAVPKSSIRVFPDG